MTGGELAPRAALAHGGRLTQARLRYPAAPEPFIDLSTGINPVPYPMPPLNAADTDRLPEPESVEQLQQVAAAAYGVADPAMVVVAPGTQILISILPLLRRLAHVPVLGPTYAEHAACWEAAGARAEEVADFASLTRGDGAVLCNPNNPDGRRIKPADILRLADTMAARGGLLVVDEAFADLEGPGLSVAGALPHPGLVVLRSFGKTYGLAGLRLGFALASPELAATIRAALGAWAVSGPAIAAGFAALPDAAWRQATAARLAHDVDRLDARLAQAGCSLVGGTKLFRLYQCPDATALHERLCRHGILVRPFATRPGWLRFGIPADEAAWARLDQALATP
jgi:cobalamin biosynthetic protein CobC